ncbi:MAG: membrane dipeptidase [Deltaproteobacteria bacterium]|nr:membrane dipeptidase [Deltaproteobacteria bacterium]MBI3293610.1 membrane dipeptidase [Deltaproteobacteria bacterium]
MVSLLLGIFAFVATAASNPEGLHFSSLVVDGHNDLAWHLREAGDMGLTKINLLEDQTAKHFHTDLVRAKKGNLGAQFWSAYVPSETMQTGDSYSMTLEQMDLIHRFVEKYPDHLEFANGTDDIRRIRKAGKIASMIGIEGGHSIENSLEKLRDLYEKGARYMTLTHWKNLSWVEAATDLEMSVGLTKFGEEVVREMNRLGMFIDISHVSAKAMRAALAVTKAPIMASHSSARAIKDHVRNVPDDVLRLVAKNGGVIMVNFYPAFIGHGVRIGPPMVMELGDECERADWDLWAGRGRVPTATVRDIVNHIDHIRDVAGIDYVGLGSDFDGIDLVPDDVNSVAAYPIVTKELAARGYSDTDVKKVLGENLMRAFQGVEGVSSRLRSLERSQSPGAAQRAAKKKYLGQPR